MAGWEDRQHELIEFVDRLRQREFKVAPMHDVDKTEARIKLQEIDPLTFLGIFNRGITNEERFRVMKEVKEKLGAEADFPDDLDGIPVLNNQASRFFGYQHERSKEDIPTLWRVFKLALADNAVFNDN